MSRRRATSIVAVASVVAAVATGTAIALFPIRTAVSAQSRPEVFKPGGGVSLPRVLSEVKPQYTAQAMRAKVQGTVLLECVVQPDGSVGNIKVVRSLDSTFGLDQEAMKAARQWQFKPGTRFGEPVPVLVTIEIAFTLR